MKTLKDQLADKHLNQAELAARIYTAHTRPVAASQLSRTLRNTVPLPAQATTVAAQLADDIADALKSSEAMLRLLNDKRLCKAPFAARIWPESTRNVAEAALRNRQHNATIVGRERHALRELLQKLSTNLRSVAAARN